jgi:hypothetical protein
LAKFALGGACAIAAASPVLALAQDASPASDAPVPAAEAAPTPEATPLQDPSLAPSDTGDDPDPTRNIEAGLEGDSRTHISVGPEGKTLPARVLRVRAPLRFANATHGYDADGKKVERGVELNVVGTAFVAEYGITDELSLQFLAPFVLSNELGMNAGEFRRTSTYKTKYDEFVATAAKLLEDTGVCTSPRACESLIQSGYALPYARTITLPTGEKLNVRAGQPVREVADSIVLNGAKPHAGETGLGDVELGALYAVLNERGPFTGSPIFLSLGGGLRFPTGSFKDVPVGKRSTGRGTLDLGLRSNLDYTPVRGFFLSWQNQAEFMLAKGKKRKGSILDSSALNEADDTTADAVDSGSDGKGNELDFERRGVRNIGFLKAALALGTLSDVVESISVNTQFKYDYDAKEYLGDVAQGDARRQYGWQAGASWDGLAYRLPLQLDVDYEIPVGGENVSLAANILSVTLKGYYRF